MPNLEEAAIIRKQKIVIIIMAILLISAIAAIVQAHHKGTNLHHKSQLGNMLSKSDLKSEANVKDSITVKPNLKDKTLSDVFVRKVPGSKPVLVASVPNLYKEHYHATEYVNGNLYVIRRLSEGNNPDDQLWKYSADKTSKEIYKAPGLDFRVSPDNKFVAIIDSNPTSSILRILDSNGTKLKDISSAAILLGKEDTDIRFGTEVWSPNSLWIQHSFGPGTAGVSKITLPSYVITKHDLTALELQAEFALNTESGKIAYSDYPIMMDADSSNVFKRSNPPITLSVYDLATKSAQTIATHKGRMFNPDWKDVKTLQYSNPTGRGVLTKIIE